MVASARAGMLSLEEERRVRLARLCAAMEKERPPALAASGLHLYSEEVVYVVRAAQRWEHPGGESQVPSCYAPFGRPLFRPGGATGLAYLAPTLLPQPLAVKPGWRMAGMGLLHLTSWRLTFQGEEGDGLDFAFEAINWAECYGDGIGIQARNWLPMYFRTPYPEWLYAFFRCVADQEVAQVPLPRGLDQRARRLGY